ncbi:phosphotransferase [Desertibaculum subflavum]|uniref:phosphotransferase n=1 Tax=Desertibaculum subflavum TaxID=2268458 RepID=UPI000E671654
MRPPAETTPVREAHRFDETALARWLAANLPAMQGPIEVRQFAGGHSNPTFWFAAGGRGYVLRKKPPGKLLPSAHAVEREYRIIRALQGSGVPVPGVHALCEDAAVIGTPFFVMDHVAGRVFRDVNLPDVAASERAAIYDAMNAVLATYHQLDWRALGLADFGRPGSYFARQIERWTRQYDAARTADIPAMESLKTWLPAHLPAQDETTLVHGDYRLENMIFHPTEPRVLAVLDWELSTLGHPLADLAYNCLPWNLRTRPGSGIAESRPAGIPSEADYVAAYCRRTGRPDIPGWKFYVAFSLFRSAAIGQGVYKRGLDGNASNPASLLIGDTVPVIAARGWALAQSM